MSHPAADDKIGCLVEDLRAAGFDLETRTADALESLQATNDMWERRATKHQQERDALLTALRDVMQFVESRAAHDDRIFVDARLATARDALAKATGQS